MRSRDWEYSSLRPAQATNQASKQASETPHLNKQYNVVVWLQFQLSGGPREENHIWDGPWAKKAVEFIQKIKQKRLGTWLKW
jgi:hypothetical protein